MSSLPGGSLTAAKAELEATTYNDAKPIIAFFTSIAEYVRMVKAASASETDSQLINIGLMITVSRTTIFAGDVRKWHDKPEADKNWPNFKAYSKEAHKAIKCSQPAVMTINFLGFHEQANLATTLADQVIKQFTTQHR